MSRASRQEATRRRQLKADADFERIVAEAKERHDPWGGQNPLGCCRYNATEGGRPTHGGPGCKWPGTEQ